MPRYPATLLLQIRQSWKMDCVVGPGNSLAYCQCIYLKLKLWMHSSRRLKDTLTEKRFQYKLDLCRSRVPLAAPHLENETLTGFTLPKRDGAWPCAR